MRRAKLTLLLAAAFAWLITHGVASADSFPKRTVKIAVPFSASSGPTLLVRLIGDKLSAIWPQRVVVEPKPGASGFNAVNAVRDAAPDGHELLIMTDAQAAINPAIYGSKLPYDPEKDFVPVAMIYSAPFYITVSATGPYKIITALTDAAKSNPGKISYGISALGNPTNLGAALFAYQTGTKMVAVPFTEQSQIYLTMVQGDIDWALATVGSALPFVQSKTVTFLGIAAKQRSSNMPDVPTVEEAGGPKGYQINSWLAVFARRGTPLEVIKQLNAEITAQLAQRDILEAMKNFGFEPASQTPEQISELIRTDGAKYAELVQRLCIQAK
jgi:tripartite-type tricarboxylate transporter receptor subunit TctC